MTQNIFKYAAKKALRFPYKGSISTEDLFKLSVEELDKIYISLNKQLEENSGKSLIKDKTPENEELEVKIAIIKEIVEDKLKAIEKAKKAVEKKAQKQKILDIMASKQDDELKGKSLDELQAELDKLDEEDAVDA